MSNKKSTGPACSTGSWVERCVQDHPDSAILACVAGGALIGIGIAAFLTSPPATKRTAADLAANLGRRMLDSLDSVTTSSLASLRDSIHRG